MNLKQLFFCFSLIIIFISCGIGVKLQYNKVYPLHQTCIFKNGIWGK